jgi:hypothetical protein
MFEEYSFYCNLENGPYKRWADGNANKVVDTIGSLFSLKTGPNNWKDAHQLPRLLSFLLVCKTLTKKKKMFLVERFLFQFLDLCL